MDRQNSLGETIRALRKQQGITQEQLAEGICSTITVSRIENDHQMPSKAVLDALLSRLHSSASQLCNVYYQKESDRKLEGDLQRAAALLNCNQLDECRKLLDRVDIASQAVPAYRQVYLMLDAAVSLSGSPDADAATHALDLLEQAVRLTQPSIDFKDMRSVLLSENEAQALALMVAAKHYAGRALDAIMLGRELLATLDAQEDESLNRRLLYLNVELNLAKCLEKQGYYEDAEELFQRVRREDRERDIQFYLPEVIYAEARGCLRKGDAAGARQRVEAVIPYLDIIGESSLAETMRGWAHRELKLDL